MFSSQFRGSRGKVPNAVAVLLAAACLFTAARADSQLEPCADDAALQRAVQRLNEVRQQGDAPCAGSAVAMRTLAWDARLAGSAQEQATDLAQRDMLSHTDARQRSFGTRLRSAGYAAAGAGENLAAGQPDFDDTLQAWLASPSHCANLMQPEFRDVGVACVQRPGPRYERFWVAHLGTPVRSTVSASAAPLNGELFAAR